MTDPNMSVAAFDRWTATEAFEEYREYRGPDTVDAVTRRTRAVLTGRASEQNVAKLRAFIKRMKANDAGRQRFGSGPAAVSARTAALRNWGYDPTGRFS
jgi:hypothetical protein